MWRLVQWKQHADEVRQKNRNPVSVSRASHATYLLTYFHGLFLSFHYQQVPLAGGVDNKDEPYFDIPLQTSKACFSKHCKYCLFGKLLDV